MMMNCPMMAGQTQPGWHELHDDAGSIRQCGFAWLFSPMSVRSSGETFGLPTCAIASANTLETQRGASE
jgi:hypothetical protein